MNLAESKLVTVVNRIVKPLLLVAALSVVGRTPLLKAQQPPLTKAQADAIGLCVVFRQIAADPSLVNAAGLSVEDEKATARRSPGNSFANWTPSDKMWILIA